MSGNIGRYTTFGIGGNANRIIVPRTAEELITACSGKYVLLGCGSKVLVSDSGYDGNLVVNRYECISFDGCNVVAGSGTKLPDLFRATARRGLSGLEFAIGIPGTVGGAVKMNAGAFGGQISDVVAGVNVLRNGKLMHLNAVELGMKYRSSNLSCSDVVVSAEFNLNHCDRNAINERALSYAAARVSTQPNGRSAGSVFKNPDGIKIARLIDELGFKGFTVGGASVSNRHANVIVNNGNATANDVVEIINVISEKLFQRYGIIAEREIIYIGDFF